MTPEDEILFGWDPTPGIVSVWADHEGQALVWRRVDGQLLCERERFRPWLLAEHLADLAHLRHELVDARAPSAPGAPVQYQELDAFSEGLRSPRLALAPPAPASAPASASVSAPATASASAPAPASVTAPASAPAPASVSASAPVSAPASVSAPAPASVSAPVSVSAPAPRAYRFLLGARSGRALARMILVGASGRLRRPIRSLDDLAGYYRVGPVEQYLTQTGRVYFRGLHYDDLHRMQIDLETTALDPNTGTIFLAAVRDTRGLAITIEASTLADERRLIERLCAIVRERDPDVIENHNLFGFDLPFLARRAEALSVPLALARPGGPVLLECHANGRGERRPRYTLAGRELIDTLDAVRRHDFVARDLPSHRLKDVARHFGVAGPDRVYVAGAEIFVTYGRDPDRVRRYALDDTAEVDALSRRLLQAPFALAGMAPRRYERLASAGPATGVLEPMLVRAHLRARAAVPMPGGDGDGLGPHEGGALHLFATGVAERVVKADIASLYPSLMRAYRIGPARDKAGALLHIVERLLELRLQHKAAARRATPGSPEAFRHEATQAAMKLIINSAYGYMGAGEIALFADRRAADEVTRRGREILDHILAALGARGVALIEADTDGVYFAMPEGSTEADERAIVAEVAAELPAGIQLEYEGRYRAMFSYEVKNYALLTHGGEVVLRGVALRSSRSEPFGERFLREALRRVMLGDVAGLRGLFVETVSALEARALPARAVATRTRLSKSPEAYLATRASHREAPYEALLAAGRRQWAPGERVRYYRARGGVHVWLPDDEAAEARRDYDREHYLHVLVVSYASRLRKAFAPEDFERIFRMDEQLGLFDRPIGAIAPLWIRCPARLPRASPRA